MAERREERANKGGKFSNRKSPNNPLKFSPSLSFHQIDHKDGLLNFTQFASFSFRKTLKKVLVFMQPLFFANQQWAVNYKLHNIDRKETNFYCLQTVYIYTRLR